MDEDREQDQLLLNNILYDPDLTGGQTLKDWATNFIENKPDWADAHRPDGKNPLNQNWPGGIDADQMEKVANTVLADEHLCQIRIEDVTNRPDNDSDQDPVHNAVFADPDEKTVTVAFAGTRGYPEWMDNATGGDLSVTDTPDQKAAARYFDEMMAKYGPNGSVAQYPNVSTSGHSKGGNLAAYVAITSGGLVNANTYSFDGQGFGNGFWLKYQDEIAAMGGNIYTYSNPRDYVNALFRPVGPHQYTTQAGLATRDFMNNHSPYTMLEADGPGTLKMREYGADMQDPGLTAIAGLSDYLQKFMDPDDFSTFCTVAMDAVNETYNKDDLINVLVKSDLFLLIGNYLKNNPNDIDAIRELLRQLGLVAIADLVLAAVGLSNPQLLPLVTVLLLDRDANITKAALQLVKDVPYSTIVRDFTEVAKQELFKIIADVTPHTIPDLIRDRIGDLFSRPRKLDFSRDDAARDRYYHEALDKYNTSRQQIDDIFEKVSRIDSTFAARIDGIGESVTGIFKEVAEMRDSLRKGDY